MGRTAIVWSGAELVAALLDEGVADVLLASDCNVTEDAWSSVSRLPALMTRNLTISGAPQLPAQPVLRLNYLRAKIRLADGVTLTLRNLALDKPRSDSVMRAPGLDLVAPTAAGQSSTIILGPDCTWISFACLPPGDRQANWIAVARPPEYPGTQQFDVAVSQVGCVNDIAAPVLKRCWADRGVMRDMVGPGLDPDRATGRTTPNNILMVARNLVLLCVTVVDKTCIEQLTAYGCLQFQIRSNAVSGTDSYVSARGGSGGGGSGGTLLAAPEFTMAPPHLLLPAGDGAAVGPPRPVAEAAAAAASAAAAGGTMSGGVLAGAVCGAVAGAVLLFLAVLLVAAALRRRTQSWWGVRGDGTEAAAHGAALGPYCCWGTLRIVADDLLDTVGVGIWTTRRHLSPSAVGSGENGEAAAGSGGNTISGEPDSDSGRGGSRHRGRTEGEQREISTGGGGCSGGGDNDGGGSPAGRRESGASAKATDEGARATSVGVSPAEAENEAAAGPSSWRWLAEAEIPVTLLTPQRADLELNVSLHGLELHGRSRGGGGEGACIHNTCIGVAAAIGTPYISSSGSSARGSNGSSAFNEELPPFVGAAAMAAIAAGKTEPPTAAAADAAAVATDADTDAAGTIVPPRFGTDGAVKVSIVDLTTIAATADATTAAAGAGAAVPEGSDDLPFGLSLVAAAAMPDNRSGWLHRHQQYQHYQQRQKQHLWKRPPPPTPHQQWKRQQCNRLERMWRGIQVQATAAGGGGGLGVPEEGGTASSCAGGASSPPSSPSPSSSPLPMLPQPPPALPPAVGTPSPWRGGAPAAAAAPTSAIVSSGIDGATAAGCVTTAAATSSTATAPATGYTGASATAAAAGSDEGGVVTLLPALRGRGAFGRVVEGLYRGQRVAVKILHAEVQMHAAAATAAAGADAEAATAGADSGCGVGGGGGGGVGAAPHFPQHDLWNDKLVMSFTQEVQVLGRCRHPNVVCLLAACVTPPRLCLVMELMETSLDQVLYGGPCGRNGGGIIGGGGGGASSSSMPSPPPPTELPLSKVLHIAGCICRALAYLHPTVTHRDLKPANVLVNNPWSDKPIVKLSDFGLARLRHTVAPTRHPEAGTPPYMAPECFDIDNFIITHKSDVYSFGVLLWEMLAGRRPWEGHDAMRVGIMVTLYSKRLPVEILSPLRCPARLRALLLSCWDHDPERRPAAAEAANELASIAEGLVAAEGPRQR